MKKRNLPDIRHIKLLEMDGYSSYDLVMFLQIPSSANTGAFVWKMNGGFLVTKINSLRPVPIHAFLRRFIDQQYSAVKNIDDRILLFLNGARFRKGRILFQVLWQVKMVSQCRHLSL